jgi:predicted dehydrogenase
MAINSVAVIGTGFIGTVHVEAIRRTGNQVKGVLSGSEKSTREAARKLRVSKAYSSVAEICEDSDISVVHVTSPNAFHAEQVKQIISAGKHVVCEKPLTLSASEGAQLLELAERAGVVHALCFNTRFYPMVHEAKARIQKDEIGILRYIHAQYHQDWLMLDNDWNWRLDPGKAGSLRAVADIGSHLLDQLIFVTGEEIEAVFAELHTLVKSRNRPMGEVQTFTSAGDVAREKVEMSSDDAAGILLRFKNGARATLSISQISGGSKNSLKWEIAGSEGAFAFDAQSPEVLWIGNRGKANEVLLKDPSLLSPEAASITFYPGGHVEGFGETFRGLFQTIYARIEDPSLPINYPTFADGVRSLKITDAIVASSHNSQWININS